MSEQLPASRQFYATSALFEQSEAVEAALVTLVRAGVPRDLIDVVVAPEAAQRFYNGLAKSPGRTTLRYAGRGGLIGLLLGALISFAIIALPGFQSPGTVAIVQLLGPNLMTVLGAVIGGLVGLSGRGSPEQRHRRAGESPGSIVVAVQTRTRGEAEAMARLLVEGGGREPRVE
jgi:hypothetical protein